jgi:hypothetical protein
MFIWEETFVNKKELNNAEFVKDRLERIQKKAINLKGNLKPDRRKTIKGDLRSLLDSFLVN